MAAESEKKYAVLAALLRAAQGRPISVLPDGSGVRFGPAWTEGLPERSFPFLWNGGRRELVLGWDGMIRGEAKAESITKWTDVVDLAIVKAMSYGLVCAAVTGGGDVRLDVLAEYYDPDDPISTGYASGYMIGLIGKYKSFRWQDIVAAVPGEKGPLPCYLRADGLWFYGGDQMNALQDRDLTERCCRQALEKAAPDPEAAAALGRYIEAAAAGAGVPDPEGEAAEAARARRELADRMRAARRRDELLRQYAALRQEHAGLKGLFAGRQRKELEKQMAEIEKQLE